MTRTQYAVSEGKKFADCANLVVVSCYSCHMRYAIPESLHNAARAWPGDRERGWKLCCPLGHEWWYTGRNLVELAEEARNDAARARAARDQARASAAAYKGVATRVKRRVANGVCPCCGRTFQQLARHMSAKHLDFVERVS